MSICPKNKSSKARRDSRRANWKMSAMNLVKCSKCGALMMPHRDVEQISTREIAAVIHGFLTRGWQPSRIFSNSLRRCNHVYLS